MFYYKAPIDALISARLNYRLAFTVIKYQLNCRKMWVYFALNTTPLAIYRMQFTHPNAQKYFWKYCLHPARWQQHINVMSYGSLRQLLATSRAIGIIMMTSSNGNIFRVKGYLCREFTGEFPPQRPVTRSFDVFFDLPLNKWLSKQSLGWWFDTPSCSLWRHCNVI